MWVFQDPHDQTGFTFHGCYILDKFKNDSLAFVLAIGLAENFYPTKPNTCNALWMTIQIRPPFAIDKGEYIEYDDELLYRPFSKTGSFIDLADSTTIISFDSTIICPVDTFNHCIVLKSLGAFAPGFGPVNQNLVYANVNGVKYGSLPPWASVNFITSKNPSQIWLHPAYPNPFNQSTGITFYLNKPGPARLTIFNSQGRTVRVLLDERVAAGSHHLTWDGMSDDRLLCPSGVYFVSLKTSEFSQKRALTLVR